MQNQKGNLMQEQTTKIKDFNFPKVKADLILSLGSQCRPAHHMRKNFLRAWASPLDWMVNENLDVIIHLFKTNFEDFFLSYERLHSDNQNTISVKDNINNILSVHHFFHNENLKIQAKRVNSQAIDRWKIIKEKIIHSQNIVFIRSGNFNKTKTTEFLKKISELFNNNNKNYYFINVNSSNKLAIDELNFEKTIINTSLTIINYNINENACGAIGNKYFWTKMMRSIKVPLRFKTKNAIGDLKTRFIRSCKKRLRFFTKKYKNNIDESH